MEDCSKEEATIGGTFVFGSVVLNNGDDEDEICYRDTVFNYFGL
jgi:hypothetical protein